MVNEIKECRYCHGIALSDVLDLGRIFPSGFVDKGTVLLDEQKAPLVLVKCSKCGLAQLKHTIDLDLMYRQYWYSSSLNKSMISSLADVVKDVESKVLIGDSDTVVDIGCNDGTMLKMYSADCVTIGFDPALNLNKPTCSYFINDYFTADAYWLAATSKAKVVTAVAMFYDLPDPVKFSKDVASILDDNGVFIVQFTDLLSMFKANAFDNICHEHLEYYRLVDVVNVLSDAGLRVIDVSYNNVNGGSLRVTAVHSDSKIITKQVVIDTLAEELNYFSKFGFNDLQQSILRITEKMQELISWSNDHRYTIHILGASTKGNTLLQVCGVTGDSVPYAAEVNKDKFGLFTAGSNIEIISEESSLEMHPDCYIVPVWHFKDSILSNSRIQDYIKSGGKLIFPMPDFIMVSNKGDTVL